MPVAIVHNALTAPTMPVADASITQALIQNLIAAVHNSTAHLVVGATTGDILIATTPATLGVIPAPATGQVLISNGAGRVPSWSAAPPLTSPTLTTPVLSGTVTGIYTLGGTPTITAPTITGTAAMATIAASAGITSSSPSAGIGYATGAGLAVTQITSRTTGVTINAITGRITTDSTSLAGGSAAAFVVTNSAVAIGDVVLVCQRSGAVGALTNVVVIATAAGSFTLSVMNGNLVTGVAETGAIIINFAIIKAVSA